MMKLHERMAALMTILTLALALAMPGPALADEHGERHGPMPIAIVGSVFGGAFWLASTPFCLLFAPMHITDSFDLLVAAPFRAAIGDER